jgi:hypothetical protein
MHAFSTHTRLPSFAIVLMTLLAAVLSLAVTGFQFGVSNNVFHIPYVLGLERHSTFSGDAYYESLDRFTSWIWPIIRSVASEQTIEEVFFSAHVLSRVAAVAAICWLFISNGLRTASALAAGLAVVAVTPWLTGASFFGRHGLFIHYFTHSEVTWGPLTAALVLMSRGRTVAAAGMSAVAFSINAFVGVWLVAMLAMAVAFAEGRRPTSRDVLKSVGLFVLIATPTAVWIATTMTGSDGRVEFSYIEYIRLYFPHHFLAEAALAHEIVKFLLMTYSGLLAALLLDNTRFWFAVIGACLLLIGVGVVLPYVLDARPVFNLHLLRVDGIVQFLTLLLIVCAALQALSRDRRAFVTVLAFTCLAGLVTAQRDGGPILVALSMTLIALAARGGRLGRFADDPSAQRRLMFWCLLPAVVVCVLLDVRAERIDGISAVRYAILLAVMAVVMRMRDHPMHVRVIEGAVLALCLLMAAARLDARIEYQDEMAEARKPYEALVDWIRESPLDGPLLIPLDDPYHSRKFETFQLDARRRVWVDWKQGAVVMWDPSFHEQWATRFEEVRALADDAARIAYARDNGIAHVVLESATCPARSLRVYGNREYAVCRVLP